MLKWYCFIVFPFIFFIAKYFILLCAKGSLILTLLRSQDRSLLWMKIFRVLNKEKFDIFSNYGTFLVEVAAIFGVSKASDFLEQKKIEEKEKQKKAKSLCAQLIMNSVDYVVAIKTNPVSYEYENTYPFQMPEFPDDTKKQNRVRPVRLVVNETDKLNKELQEQFSFLDIDTYKKVVALFNKFKKWASNIQGYLQAHAKENTDMMKTYLNRLSSLEEEGESIRKEAEELFLEK